MAYPKVFLIFPPAVSLCPVCGFHGTFGRGSFFAFLAGGVVIFMLVVLFTI